MRQDFIYETSIRLLVISLVLPVDKVVVYNLNRKLELVGKDSASVDVFQPTEVDQYAS